MYASKPRAKVKRKKPSRFQPYTIIVDMVLYRYVSSKEKTTLKGTWRPLHLLHRLAPTRSLAVQGNTGAVKTQYNGIRHRLH